MIYNMDMTGDPGPGGGLSSPLGHSTRTLVFDNEGRLYISVGSLGNVDGDSYVVVCPFYSLYLYIPIRSMK